MAESTHDFVDAYLRETAEIALGTNREDMSRVIDTLFEAYRNDRTIYTCGNGGSAANASHLACDIAKFTWADGKKRFKCVSLCDNAALISALTNDVGFNRIFLEQLDGRVEAGDVLDLPQRSRRLGRRQGRAVVAEPRFRRGFREEEGRQGRRARRLRRRRAPRDGRRQRRRARGEERPHLDAARRRVPRGLPPPHLRAPAPDGPRLVSGRRRGVVLDRDGTLIDVVRDAELGVITTAFHPSQLRLLPGVVEGLRALADAGFVLAIATNQPGAAKGQIPVAAIVRTNEALVAMLAASGVTIAPRRGRACITPTAGPAETRRSSALALQKAPARACWRRSRASSISTPSASWMIGDRAADLEAARAAGMRAGLLFDPQAMRALSAPRAARAATPDLVGGARSISWRERSAMREADSPVSAAGDESAGPLA